MQMNFVQKEHVLPGGNTRFEKRKLIPIINWVERVLVPEAQN